MTNEKEWWEERTRKLFHGVWGASPWNEERMTDAAIDVLRDIVAEAERRGEIRALEEMVWNGMFPKNLPKSMENGYLACGMDLNEKIDAKLTSLKKV